MKYLYKSFLLIAAATFVSSVTSCSDKDEPNGGHHDWCSDILYFNNVPEHLIGGPTAYGANLYYGSQGQITTGYISNQNNSLYLQFPVNYGLTYDEYYNQVWGYSFFNGGMAVSKWHNMEDDSYLNQLSVYNISSPSGGNFVVTNGNSDITDPNQAKYSDYERCGHIYFTDAKGYYVENPGTENFKLEGEGPIYKETFFSKLKIANTTYVYNSLKDGNAFTDPLQNNGWFKVQFIAFDNDESESKPVGYVEAYLANLDYAKRIERDLYGIRDDWYDVDLSSLPVAKILVVNFVGSDVGEYGLNTPAYCAIDEIHYVYW